MKTILGINTESDGSGAAVVVGNRVMSAVEQFKIRDHWSSRDNAPVPGAAVLTALQAAGVQDSEVDIIALAGDVASAEQVIPHIRNLHLNPRARIEPVEHRVAHSTAAFYTSPFDRAAILILGRGTEPGSFCFADGDRTRIDIEEMPGRHIELDILYSRICDGLGFESRTSNKMAWLGATGEPEFLDVFHELMSSNRGNSRADELLKAVDFRRPQNVAASLQAWTNEVVIGLAEDFCRRRDLSNICVAGHLAENPLLVRGLERHFGADRVFIPPAPGREILSIGAALAQTRCEAPPPPELRFMYPALGPEFPDSQIKEELDNCKLVCSFFPGLDALVDSTCKTLTEGGIVGWFQGRCEFGHRALGFRSIVANPFTPYIDENINRFLKHRERFHPFVISVTQESASDYFEDVGANARTIASVYAVRDSKRSLLSKFALPNACVRVHTVSAEENHPFWTLLRKMELLTGHPLLINSSFNLPNEPLVLTPRDAIRTFYASGLDLLAIGRFLLEK
jgi:carbamoyltransferase